jgi:hypothetical protein
MTRITATAAIKIFGLTFRDMRDFDVRGDSALSGERDDCLSAGAGCVCGFADGLTVTVVPQLVQNFVPGLTSAPH